MTGVIICFLILLLTVLTVAVIKERGTSVKVAELKLNDLGSAFENSIANFFNEEKGIHVFSNVILPYEYITDERYEGEIRTKEIDLILIATGGVYVIEAKDYNAKIETHKNGLMAIYPKKKFFFNPMKQAEKGKEVLGDITGCNHISTAVIFSESSTLTEEVKEIEQVYQENELEIIRENLVRENILSEIEISRICCEIEKKCFSDREAHVRELKRR